MLRTIINTLKAFGGYSAQMNEKDMLYKGYTIQPYSPKAGTGLSSHELNQPGCYRDVKDVTAVAQFKVVKEVSSLIFFSKIFMEIYSSLAWTTTPWTLPFKHCFGGWKKNRICKG